MADQTRYPFMGLEEGAVWKSADFVRLLQAGRRKMKAKCFLQILPTQPFLFLLQDSLYGFPILFTVTSEHIRLFTF